MWSRCIWDLTSLIFYLVVVIIVSRTSKSSTISTFTEEIFKTVVSPVRINIKGHPYPLHQQFNKRGQPPWHGKVRYRVLVSNHTWLLDLYFHHRLPHRHRHKHWPHHLKVFDDSSPEVKEYVKAKCYYIGKVLGQPESLVAVSLCGGMTGDIHFSLGSYVIHPLYHEYRNMSNRTLLHSLSPLLSPDPRRPWRPLKATGIAFCDVQDDTSTIFDRNPSNPAIMHFPEISRPLRRQKRSESRELHLEVLVVADSKMVQFHGSNLKHYILTLMATVALIYKDPSIGNNINIAVVDITTLDQSVDSDVIHTVAPTTLRKFCTWQQKHNTPDDQDPSHYDAAVLITREDLCRYPGACDTLGLAQSGMMCDPYSSCAIVEDNGLSAAFTIAHELGHVMSIPHDDDKKCFKHHDEAKYFNVMARMLDYNSHPWSWSQCSRHYLTMFFDVGYGHCLTDRPKRNLLLKNEEFQQPPGKLYTRDRQCQLVFGHKSRICPYMPECKRLWCAMDDDTLGGCRTQHMPWADGTHCDIGKHCFQGECVRMTPTRLTPIDGQWGPWKPFGKCSRTCGGGVQQAIRECDSPKPENGGRYCIGVRIKYKPCNTQECPHGSRDFRAIQCEEYNGLQLPGLPFTPQWIPHYVDFPPTHQCKLYCRVAKSQAYFVLREKVIDGTPCQPSSYDICVNGNCEKAGCDRVLWSNKTLDRCGVCGGTNKTCREISGQFNKTVDYGYHDVAMLPPGASNIQIKQQSPNNEVDENYIALRDSEKNYVLNGDYMISMFPKTIQYHGTTIDYSGSNFVIERLNATKPLKRDLYIQVLIVGNLQPPQISFSYTVPLSDGNLYSWQLAQSFSECSKMCNGTSYRKPVCVRQSDLQLVNEGHCPELPRLRIEHKRSCNLNCTLEWQTISKSECSVQCGRGFRQLIVKCMKIDIRAKLSHAVPEELCSDLAPKPPTKEECHGNCLNSTWIFSDWSECSTSCNPGVQTRTAKCRNIKNELQPNSHCPAKELVTQKVCDFGPCPYWEVGNWTECSVSCGHGVMRRDVVCIHINGKSMDNDLCSVHLKPHTVEECSPKPCLHPTGHHEYNIWKKKPIPSMSLVRDLPKKWPELKEDANVAVVIGIWRTSEWSECSATCGRGYKSRAVTCHNPDDDSRMSLSNCDEFEKPREQEGCVILKCLEWKTEPWMRCSCEIGIRRRNVFCPDKSYLCDLKKKPHSKERCTCEAHVRHRNIPRWYAGPWSECSVTCDEGMRHRRVACVNGHGQPVDNKKCHNTPPDDTEKCMLAKCPSWRWSEWTQCSVSCGSGLQKREVYCDKQNNISCNEREKPVQELRICSSLHKCGQTFRWRKGSWSRCSEACGIGHKTREVVCIDNKHQRQDPFYCAGLEKPQQRKQCFLKHCAFTWVAGQWSECSTTCDEGVLSRSVTCHHMNSYGWINPEPAPESSNFDDWCDLSKRPRNTKLCNYGHCAKGYIWKPEKWTQCSGKCGKERQKRKIKCYNHRGEKVHRKFCNKKNKPAKKRPCKMQSLCKPGSCRDIQRIKNVKTNGNYTIYIKGKEITVFCHAMNTTDPQNFISLDKQNYAQIYSTGVNLDVHEPCDLKDTKPRCDCDRLDKGFTRFSKIAFDATTLRVLINDFTFSETLFGEKVQFATAGDCFSGMSCPKGKFSVSLFGTGLRISDRTSWTSKEGYSQSIIHRTAGGQLTKGYCGGYCGTCIPHPEYGLLLDILIP